MERATGAGASPAPTNADGHVGAGPTNADDDAPHGAPTNPAPHVGAGLAPAPSRLKARWFGLGLGVACARALLMAGAAAATSGGDLAFLLTWTLILFPGSVLLGLLELPLIAGPNVKGRAPKAALWAATGLVLGALLVAFVPWLRSLGAAALIPFAAGGMFGALLAPESLRAPKLALGSGAVWIAFLTVLFVLDPEGTYNQRYVENRLTAEQLAAPPVFADRDPASLSDAEVAKAIAATWMRTHPPEGLRWSWEEAVALEGLLQAGALHPDLGVEAFAQQWVERHVDLALSEPLWADAAAPASTAMAVGGDPRVTARVTDYLLNHAPRTRAGAYSHLGQHPAPPQAWIDSLFMHGVFLHRLALRDREAGWAIDAAADLAVAMASDLRDPQSGLFKHAAIDVGPTTLVLPCESTFWARGNAWLIYFLVDHQRTRAALGQPRDPRIQDLLEGLLTSVLDAQDPETGLWRTDLLGDAEGNPLETSASALILCALTRARHAKLLDATQAPTVALRRARAGVRQRIRWDRGHPTVTGISTGTMPGFARYYRAVPVDENVGHGVGAVLLALCEPEL